MSIRVPDSYHIGHVLTKDGPGMISRVFVGGDKPLVYVQLTDKGMTKTYNDDELTPITIRAYKILINEGIRK